MGYIIRELLMDDSEGIYLLNKNEMGYDYPFDETRERLSKLSESSVDRIFVAVNGKEVIGYVHANDYDLIYFPHMKNIMGIAVADHWKRKGVGRALLQQVEVWAKETNAKGVRLVSGATRTAAHEFYHRCGYSGDKAQVNLTKMFE